MCFPYSTCVTLDAVIDSVHCLSLCLLSPNTCIQRPVESVILCLPVPVSDSLKCARECSMYINTCMYVCICVKVSSRPVCVCAVCVCVCVCDMCDRVSTPLCNTCYLSTYA